MNVLFAKMAMILRHHDDDRLEQSGTSESKLLVGRIGLPYQNPVAWPVDPVIDGLPIRTFVSGPLLEGGPNSVDDKLPDGVGLCRWRGFFSAVIIDPQRGATLIVTDRRASVPIFFVQTERWLLFAPEVKALLVASSVQKDVDGGALATFLAQGYLLGSQTLFRSIRRLRGGELLRVENGRVSKEVYWRFAPGSAIDGTSNSDLERELGQLIGAAAGQHLGDPAKTIIFLSGGTDSRGILGGALATINGHGERLNTVSWGVGPGPDDSDVAVAAQIARGVGTNHRFVKREIANYRENFTRVNSLVDGLSEIAAFHACEYQIMVDLRAAGFERVLRGDEVFGWSFPASTTEGALALVYLRRLRDALGVAPVIRAEHYKPLSEASNAAIEEVLSEVRDLPPNQAKDYFYFAHRLQCFLHTASYYRQVELDQRNVLLDEPILSFMIRVPERLRINKRLYRNAVARKYPNLARFPFAKRGNLEDWTRLLAAKTPVRAYAVEELSERSSGIWEFLDPVALMNIVEALGRGAGKLLGASPRSRLKSLTKQTLQATAPRLLAWVQTGRHARPAVQLEPDKIVMRSLVLKHWYDSFVARK